MAAEVSPRTAGAAPAVIGVLMVLGCVAVALTVAGALTWRSRSRGRDC